MNKLIAVVGPSGVGKTSLVRALHATGRFAAGLEDHAGRPFQALFDRDKRYALANQLDYLVYRAEQERQLRVEALPALTDGGLDMDFHGFTRLFHYKGWLSETEFELCSRFYDFARGELPTPERVIALSASPRAIRARLAGRERINIASEADMELLEGFLEEWFVFLPPERVIRLDVTDETPAYARSVSLLRKRL